MKTVVKPTQFLLIANATQYPAYGGDRGDFVSAHDTYDEAANAAERCGYHPGVLIIARATERRLPRGAVCEEEEED